MTIAHTTDPSLLAALAIANAAAACTSAAIQVQADPGTDS